MFDIGFSELIVIGIVALVVIGPERLPRVAKTVGHLLGRAQRYVGDVKADINREMQLEELKKMQAEMASSFRSVEDTVRSEVDAARSSVETPLQEAASAAETPVREAAAEVTEERPEDLPKPVATYGLAEQIELASAETPPAVTTPKTDKTAA